MADFVLFLLFGFTLTINLKNFDFESHWNTLILFDQKLMADLNMSCKRVSDLVKFCFLRGILTISSEIWILNFIEIV